MAVERYTLGFLKQRLSFAFTNLATVPTVLSTEFAHALNIGIRMLVATADSPAFRATGSFSTVIGTSDYSLPEDFVRMIDPGVRINQSPYYRILPIEQQAIDANPSTTDFGARQLRPLWYSLLERDSSDGCWMLRMHPIPDAVYPISFRYFSYPQPLTELADTDEIDARFPVEGIQGLIASAALQFPQYLGRDQVELYLMQKADAERALRRARETIVGKPEVPNLSGEVGSMGSSFPGSLGLVTATPYGS